MPMIGQRFIQTVKGYLPVQPLPWKRGPSIWLLSQTPWKCRMIMPLCLTSIYKWKWWPPKQMNETWTQLWERSFSTPELPKGNLAEPHYTQGHNQRDVESARCQGALAERLISRCDVKNTTLFCHLLLLAELWRTAWTLFKLLSIPLPITFFELGSAIFLLTLALIHFACIQWLYMSNICNLLIYFLKIHPCKMVKYKFCSFLQSYNHSPLRFHAVVLLSRTWVC